MHNSTHPSMRPGASSATARTASRSALQAGGTPEGDESQGSNGQDVGSGADAGQNGQNGDNGDGGTGSGSPVGDDQGAGQSSGGSCGQQADDSAARTIAAIRADYKTERGKRQKLK